MNSFLLLGGKFLDEFTSSLWFPFSGILLVWSASPGLCFWQLPDREAVLTRLRAGSKRQGSSSKIPNPRKKFNQEFKKRCDAGRAARGQGLSSPSSSDRTISESPAQGDLGVKDTANLWKDAGSNGLSKGYGCSSTKPSSSAFNPQATCAPRSLLCH